MGRDLKALLKISTAVNSVRKLEVLERQLMECVFEVVPAARGEIMLTGENPDEFVSVFSWDRASGVAAPFPASIKADVLKRFPGKLVEFYGLTEGGGTTILMVDERPDKISTCGRPLDGHDIRIIDEAGR